MSIWQATVGGEYRNPILYGDYSDPDVIRVGDDFYMIASSFTYVPGVPVLHSKDLVNWELINYCVRWLPFERYDRPVHGCGTWAPSLRYHDGRFYAFIPMPDEGIFVTAAENPAGEWSPLRCVKSVRGWIDPCPIWDDDGRAYMAFAYANSRCGIKHRLSVVEIDPVTCEVIGEPVLVFDGTLSAPTVEGPKLYKHNGWYYIFAPAGGVPTGWQLTLRGRSIFGPYESKIVLHQGGTPVNGPHQGGWVALQDGRDFFIHFQDVGPMGRIIHLQPMCWQNDWPFIGVEQDGDGIGEPVAKWPLPFPDRGGDCLGIVQDDDFTGEALALHWQFQCNPNPTWYDCAARKDALRLFTVRNPCRDGNPLWFAGNALTQIPQAPDFDAALMLTLCPEREGDLAGLGVIGHRYGFLALALKERQPVLRLIQGAVEHNTMMGMAEGTVRETELACIPVADFHCRLQMRVRGGCRVNFAYEDANGECHEIGGEMPVEAGTWTGFKVAIFALNGQNIESKGFADMEELRFTPGE